MDQRSEYVFILSENTGEERGRGGGAWAGGHKPLPLGDEAHPSHAHVLTHTLTHTHVLTHTLTQTHVLTHTLTHTHVLTHTLTHPMSPCESGTGTQTDIIPWSTGPPSMSTHSTHSSPGTRAGGWGLGWGLAGAGGWAGGRLGWGPGWGSGWGWGPGWGLITVRGHGED